MRFWLEQLVYRLSYKWENDYTGVLQTKDLATSKTRLHCVSTLHDRTNLYYF